MRVMYRYVWVALVVCTALTGSMWAQEDPLPDPVIDDTTQGAWMGTYGECGYTLSAYDAVRGCEIPILDGVGQCELPTCDPATLTPQCPGSYQGGASQDILDCESESFDLNSDGTDDWRYRVYAGPNFGSGKILMNPDGSCSGANGLWFNSRASQCPTGGDQDMSYDIQNVPAGQYRISFFVMDWNGGREQNIQVCVAGTCSDPAGVANYEGGVYVKFAIDVGAGETITVTHTNTGGGSNAVVQGVFFDDGTPECANGKACYLGVGSEDTVSRGNWLWEYGYKGYMIFNRPATGFSCLPIGTPAPNVLTGGFDGGASPVAVVNNSAATWNWGNSPPDPACGMAMAWIWDCTSDNTGLENPGRCGGPDCGVGAYTAATWDDAGERQRGGPDLFVDVEVDLPGVYELTFHAVDYDSNVRMQRYHLYQYHTYNPIQPVVDIGPFPNGKYVTYTLEGPFKVTLRAEYYAGANSIISGVFIDPAPGYLCEGEPTGGECPDPIEPGDFCTYTIGGWGAGYHGSNPGTIRDDNWNTVYPPGLVGDSDGDGFGDLVIGTSEGSCNSLTFTDPAAVEAYLPCGGTPAKLHNTYVDPVCGKGGSKTKNTLASQVTALTLNVDYSCAGVLPAEYGDDPDEVCLGDLVITSGPFVGMTVYEFLDVVEQALSCGTLDPALDFGDYNWTASAINENFAGCEDNLGFLECPGTGEPPVECEVYIIKDVGPDQDINQDGNGPDGVPGDTLTFTLNVEAGSDDLTDVVVTDVLPTFNIKGTHFDYYNPDLGSVTFIPDLGQTWSWDDASNTLTFELGDIASGNSVTIRYEADINLFAPIGSEATNTATVSATSPSGTCIDEDDATIFIVPGTPTPPPNGGLTDDIGTPGFWCNRIPDTSKKGNPNVFDVELVEQWLADIHFASRWFEGLTVADAKSIICDANANAATKKLERHLLTLWFNVASYNVWTDIRLEQLCLGPVNFPVGTNEKLTVGQVIINAEQALIDGEPDATLLFWKDIIDAINNADSPWDCDGDGYNGLQNDPVVPFDPRFDGMPCHAGVEC